MTASDDSLQRLVDAVAGSSKYRAVAPELVRAIGARELQQQSSWKAAVKATKNKLHQTAGAYQSPVMGYDAALALLQDADTPQAWRAASRKIMRGHASTRERLPILDEFFVQTLEQIPPPRTVLDLACGLNPLARPWMPLDPACFYTAYDVYADAMQFLQQSMDLAGYAGQAAVRDVLHDPPTQKVDLALLLKTLPILEQLQKGATAVLLDALQARFLLISYPVSSLGGRQKGMIATYDAQFAVLQAERGWSATRFLFATELAFLVDTAVGESA
jgi:16S rRNA (guanine(1405)-N(7))-methyltransferase